MARRLRTPDLAAALVALNAAPMGRASICRLALDPEAWLGAAAAEDARLAASLGVPADVIAHGRTVVQTATAVAAAERAGAAALGARLLTQLDTDYPVALRQLALPPPVLYVRGALPPALASGAGAAVAIVGSRYPSTYGREAAWLFARDLARAGVVVVSGFARGVDAHAHRGALAGEGLTVAVLGCGIDVAYPREHHSRRGKAEGLADEVAARGALLSELPLGAPPLKGHFPIRNRLIAALTQATLVVEAAVRSGSLITARCALELGREVLALPGRIFDDNAMGTNALIADGARPALHPRDVLAALSLDAPEAAAGSTDVPPPLPGLGARLWEALPPGAALGADELAARCAAPIDTTLAELLELELAGWIARLPGPLYCRRG
ncbi:MAG TPA: DNA-processing protein DprA [Thermoanaerobaculia bacterium]|nr:DNA-processing protein DprA [Thermoanaerobaculia bacterium]HXT49698.1 DNA-processing protein DprA [Thermoanaerobaculia bacterium]